MRRLPFEIVSIRRRVTGATLSLRLQKNAQYMITEIVYRTIVPMNVGQSMAHLQPAADSGIECPAEIPRHTCETGDWGACERLDASHHKGL